MTHVTHEDMKVFGELFVEIGAAKARVEAKYADYEKCIAALTAERDALKAEMEKSSRDWNAVREAHDRRVSEINDLKTEVARLTDNLKREMTSVALLKDDMVRLQKILDDWAGLVAAHQPSPSGTEVKPVATYPIDLNAALRPAGEKEGDPMRLRDERGEARPIPEGA